MPASARDAKGLLTDYASEFEDMDQFGMVRFVAGLAVETVVEKRQINTLIPALKDAGATGILELPIAKIVH